MIKEILNATGLPYRRGRFTKPRAGTYVVYTDSVDADGPDGINAIYTHNYTVEVYEAEPDDAAEAAIEAAIDATGLHWHKEDRFWLQSEQRYQVVYEFIYIEVGRI